MTEQIDSLAGETATTRDLRLQTLPFEYKSKDITPSINWKREAQTEEVLDNVP